MSIRNLKINSKENQYKIFLSPYQQISNRIPRKCNDCQAINKECYNDATMMDDTKLENRDIILEANTNLYNNNKLSNIDVSNANRISVEEIYRKSHSQQQQQQSHHHQSQPEPKKYHSALNRIRNESVTRSKSFQEQGVKPILRKSRFFVNRHNRNTNYSNYSLDTVSQNIEINIQDEHGCNVATPVVENKNGADLATTPPSYSGGRRDGHHHEHLKSGHILGRIFRRMQKISLGWRKSRCKFRRGD